MFQKKKQYILNRQKNQWNAVFLDDWVMLITPNNLKSGTVKQLTTAKAVQYSWLRFLALLGMVVLVVGFFQDGVKKTTIPASTEKYFAIAPHFTLQPKTISTFYAFLKSTYRISDQEPLNIVLISPDHYNAITGNIMQVCAPKVCFQNICVPSAEEALSWLVCLNEQNTKEHGLWSEFSFIQTTFPQAKVYPIIVKPRKFIDDDTLINTIQHHAFVGKTIVIASVDFSHYTDENFAALHDKKTFYVLNNVSDAKEYENLEVDCPSCLYVVNKLAQQQAQYPRLYLRDSSSTIAGRNLGTNNTSRQFIYFTGAKLENNGFTLAFFGDLIFDRQVAKVLSGDTRIKNQLETFFQNEDSSLSPSFYPHRKLFGIDMVGFNLETPVVADKKICQTSGKEVSFCSSDEILPYLQSLGFTLANIANNHSFDGWIQAQVETITQLKNNDIVPIGYVKSGKYFEQNYEYKTTIRWIPIAREGFDFTITPRTLFPTYCDLLKKNTADWYINIVSAHRGLEYQTTHNASQESLGEQLIDCGADIIIGHHPHVVQDIWRYQGKPIIYSLWNFLFDMHVPNTETWEYVLIDYNITSKHFSVTTGAINATVR